MTFLFAFDRPIFLLGCARSGTTALSVPLYLHPDTGPKPIPPSGNTPQEFLNEILDHEKHLAFSEALERKQLWFDFFGQRRTPTDMGAELIIEKAPRSPLKRWRLFRHLESDLDRRRLFLKSPSLSFRVKALREIFPTAVFVAIHRNGCDVVSSWGARHYGFGAVGYQQGIDVLARKWNETIDYLLDASRHVDIYQLRYEDLTARPNEELRRLFDYCELTQPRYVSEPLSFANRVGFWRNRIPMQHHRQLLDAVRRNNHRLGYLDSD